MKILDLYKTTFRFIKDCWVLMIICLVYEEVSNFLSMLYYKTVNVTDYIIGIGFLIAVFCYMIKGKLTWPTYFKFIKSMPIGVLVAIVVRVIAFDSMTSLHLDYIPFEIVRFILFCFIIFFLDFFAYCCLLAKTKQEPLNKLITQLLRENLKLIMWVRIKSLIFLMIVFIVFLVIANWIDMPIILEAMYKIIDVIFLAEMLLAPFIVKNIFGGTFTDKKDNHQLHLQN